MIFSTTGLYNQYALHIPRPKPKNPVFLSLSFFYFSICQPYVILSPPSLFPYMCLAYTMILSVNIVTLLVHAQHLLIFCFFRFFYSITTLLIFSLHAYPIYTLPTPHIHHTYTKISTTTHLWTEDDVNNPEVLNAINPHHESGYFHGSYIPCLSSSLLSICRADPKQQLGMTTSLHARLVSLRRITAVCV